MSNKDIKQHVVHHGVGLHAKGGIIFIIVHWMGTAKENLE